MPTNSNEVGTLIIEEVADDLKVTERTIYRLAGARKTFSNGSSKAGTPDTGPFAPPPVALRTNSQHGAHLLCPGPQEMAQPGRLPDVHACRPVIAGSAAAFYRNLEDWSLICHPFPSGSKKNR